MDIQYQKQCESRNWAMMVVKYFMFRFEFLFVLLSTTLKKGSRLPPPETGKQLTRVEKTETETESDMGMYLSREPGLGSPPPPPLTAATAILIQPFSFLRSLLLELYFNPHNNVRVLLNLQ